MHAKLYFLDYLFSATHKRSNCECLFTWNRLLSSACTGNILLTCKLSEKWSNCSLPQSNKKKFLVMVRGLFQKSSNWRLLFIPLWVRNFSIVFPRFTQKGEYWLCVSGSKWIKNLCFFINLVLLQRLMEEQGPKYECFKMTFCC